MLCQLSYAPPKVATVWLAGWLAGSGNLSSPTGAVNSCGTLSTPLVGPV